MEQANQIMWGKYMDLYTVYLLMQGALNMLVSTLGGIVINLWTLKFTF